MATLEIHAGDFTKGKGAITIMKGVVTITPARGDGDGLFAKTHTFSTVEIKEIALGSEENVKKIGGTVGWGVTGAALLGPVGLLAGLLLGGKSKEVTFIIQFIGGKKILATTDSKTYTQLTALTF